MELAKAMEKEDGVEGAVRAFLKHLPQQMSDKCAPTKTSKLPPTKKASSHPPKKSSAQPPKRSSSFYISGCFGCS